MPKEEALLQLKGALKVTDIWVVVVWVVSTAVRVTGLAASQVVIAVSSAAEQADPTKNWPPDWSMETR